MFPCGLCLRRALTHKRDPHADPLNGALSQMLCHRSLLCIPLLNHYGLIRVDTHLPRSSCAAPHQPSDQQYLYCLKPYLNSVLLVAGQPLCWGSVEKKWQQRVDNRKTGGAVCACFLFFFFLGGNNCQFRLWLQIRDWFWAHDRQGVPVSLWLFWLGRFCIGSQFGLSIKCDVRKSVFFWFIFLFFF